LDLGVGVKGFPVNRENKKGTSKSECVWVCVCASVFVGMCSLVRCDGGALQSFVRLWTTRPTKTQVKRKREWDRALIHFERCCWFTTHHTILPTILPTTRFHGQQFTHDAHTKTQAIKLTCSSCWAAVVVGCGGRDAAAAEHDLLEGW
jgi:hypothetical protein